MTALLLVVDMAHDTTLPEENSFLAPPHRTSWRCWVLGRKSFYVRSTVLGTGMDDTTLTSQNTRPTYKNDDDDRLFLFLWGILLYLGAGFCFMLRSFSYI